MVPVNVMNNFRRKIAGVFSDLMLRFERQPLKVTSGSSPIAGNRPSTNEGIILRAWSGCELLVAIMVRVVVDLSVPVGGRRLPVSIQD